MDILRIVYASQPFGFDDAMLNGILSDARFYNSRDDITGALICRADIYFQLIEGPEAAIKAAYARIAADDRHLDVNRLLHEVSTERMFPKWAMLDDQARSWMWTQKEVAEGAISRASRAEILAVFHRLKTETAAGEDHALQSGG